MLIAFVILTLVASLAWWRASPLYSFKSTLKLVGATLLIGAVAVGAGLAIFDGPLRSSPVAQAVVGLIAFLAVATGAMVLIVRITDSHVANLPSSVKIVTLHRHKVLRWLWRLVAYLFINAAAPFIVPASWQWLPLFLGGFVLIVCGPMLGLLYMMARRDDRGLTSITLNPWTHWQYSEEQWQAWIKEPRDLPKEFTGNWKNWLLFFAICAACFGCGVLLDGGFTRENTYIFFGLFGFVLLLVLAFYLVAIGKPGRQYRRLLAAPRETYFGDEGVFFNGEYMPWILSGRYLLGASLEAGPSPSILLTFESFNGSRSIKLDRHILIPENHTDDLAILDKKLRIACTTASIHLRSH